jgi:hypothetical protein
MDTLNLGRPDAGALLARWRVARTERLLELVTHEGAAIWLFRRLRAIGAIEVLPPDIGDRLRQHAFEDAASRMEVEAEASAVVSVLNLAAVPLILIKGIARTALAAQYPYLDARATLDVDVLVPLERATDADAALRADGYADALPTGYASPPGHHHSPPLHKGRITVELHTSTSTRLTPEAAWARASDRSDVVQWAGHSVRVPSVTELAWSAIAHAMEDEVAGFRLKRFLEVSALVNGGAAIDWDTLQQRATTAEAFEPHAGVVRPELVIRNWLAAALDLVGAEKRPLQFHIPEFDLRALLAWRATVLRARPRIGRATAERLMAEGGRTLAGLPLEPSPRGASRWGRIRRGVAGRVSRGAFGAWRATRRD